MEVIVLKSADLGVDDLDGFVDDVISHIEDGAKADGALPATQDKQAKLEGVRPETVAQFAARQIEGEQQAGAAHGGDRRLLPRESLQISKKPFAFGGRVGHEILLLHYAEKMFGADVI